MINDKFVARHIGPRSIETGTMLEKIGVSSLDELIEQTVPEKHTVKPALEPRKRVD